MAQNTPKFRIEHRTAGSNRLTGMTNAAWKSSTRGPYPGYGRPNVKNLQAYIVKFNSSLDPGECNAHLRADDAEYSLVAARIVRQEDDTVVASINWS